MAQTNPDIRMYRTKIVTAMLALPLDTLIMPFCPTENKKNGRYITFNLHQRRLCNRFAPHQNSSGNSVNQPRMYLLQSPHRG